MEVILLEKIGKLGSLGDRVSVKGGYARNFLLPQGRAVLANETNITHPLTAFAKWRPQIR